MWQFLSRFEATKTVASTPMVLCLKNHHFTTITHGQKVPEEWYALGKDSNEHPTSQSLLEVPKVLLAAVEVTGCALPRRRARALDVVR